MEYYELLLTSLASKRCKALISRISWKEITKIIYDSTEGPIAISVVHDDGDRIEPFRIFLKSSVQYRRIEDIKLGEHTCGVIRYDKRHELVDTSFPYMDTPIGQINGEQLDLAQRGYLRIKRKMAAPKYPDLVVYSEGLDDSRALEAFQKHLIDIFGNHLVHELDTVNDQSGNMFLPKFMNLDMSFICLDKATDAKKMNEFFSAHPNQKCIQLKASKLVGHLAPSTEMLNADTLVLTGLNEPDTITDILINFKGRVLIVDWAKFTTDGIIELLGKWKRKESFENMKTLRVSNRWNHVFDPELVKQEAGFKELNSSEEPKVVPFYPRSYHLRHMQFEQDETRQTTITSYIVREDGIVAYVAVTENEFVLEVQQFTENEMM